MISPVNYTTAVFDNFLSTASTDQPTEWYEAPIFLCLLVKSGYNVVYWSNQSASCSYIHRDGVEACHVKNKLQFDFDGAFQADFAQHLTEVTRGEHNFYFIHLMGQHFDYSNRYEEGRGRFTPKDYFREDLTEDQLQVVADYDNATLYNDSVVDAFIQLFEEQDAVVVCLSDHGEEVFDYRPVSGRYVFDKENVADWMANEVEVPFVIYVTAHYKESHPDMVRRIEAARHRPFMTDDLPHLLFDLAGLQNKWFDPKRSLINDSFDVNRRRKVRVWGVEAFDYDSVMEERKMGEKRR